MDARPRDPCLAGTVDRFLVGHLVASAPPRGEVASAGSAALAVAGHGLALLVALALTAHPPIPGVTHSSESELVFPVIRPVPDLPPPPVATESRVPVVVPRPGFQTLLPPSSIPVDIPPIRPGLAVNEADYGGVGEEGGRAVAAAPGPVRPVTAEDVEKAPVFVPVTVAPELRNREDVARALERLYPQTLKDAGITGRVVVWVLVDEQGRVANALVKDSSGVPPLDAAALEVTGRMRFSPGYNRDVATKVWASLALDFRLKR